MPYYITDPDGSLREISYRKWQEHESPGNPDNLSRFDPITTPDQEVDEVEHDFTE